MKRLLASLLLLVACGDDDGSSGTPDAAAGADASQAADAAQTVDAAILPDAPPVVPDAGDVLANCGTPLGQASVVVPPGATLVVHCPDGQPSAILPGGAQPVSIDVVAGTMVSMIGDEIPITMLDIQVGQLVDPFSNGNSNQVAIASVSLPGTFAGATEFGVESGCNNLTSATVGVPTDLFVEDSCSADGKFAIYAVAFDGNGQPIAYTFAQDVAVGAGNPSVNLPDWRTDFITVPLHLDNAPAPFAGGVMVVGARGGFGAGPGHFQTTDVDPDMIATGAGLDLDIGFIPAAFADRLIVKVFHGSFNPNDPNDTGAHTLFRRISPIPADVTIDLTADSLPLVHDFALDVSMPGRPGVAWTETGSLAAVDVKVGGLISQAGGWQFIGPPTTTSPTHRPVFPPSLGVALPAPPLQPLFFAIDIDSVDGYADVLGGAIGQINPDGFDEPKGVNLYRVLSGGDM